MTDKQPITGQPTTHWSYLEEVNKKAASQALYAPGHDHEAKANAVARVTKAYTEDTPDNEAKRNATKAAAWRYNAEHERMDRLRSTDPAAFAKLPPTMKIGLGYYLAGKEAAAAAGMDTDAPA